MNRQGNIYIKEIRFNNNGNEDYSYIGEIPAVKYLFKRGKLAFKSPVTMFVGENGTGKSTLLEAIALSCGFNAEGGSKNFQFSTSDTHSELYKSIKLIRSGFPEDGYFLRGESFYNLATNIDELDISDSYGGRSLHARSHGEGLMTLIQSRFRGRGIYLLDEPESALSPMRIMTLIVEMNELIKKGSQFIICTHSPILMTFPGACIYEFGSYGIREVSYKDTEHYAVTKEFINSPEKMLGYLIGKDE